MTQPLVNDTSAANTPTLDAKAIANLKRRRAKRARMAPGMKAIKALLASKTITPEEAQRAKKYSAQINKLVAQMMRGDADGEAGQGNAAPNGSKVDPSAKRAVTLFGKALKQSAMTEWDDQDVLETGPDRVADSARFLGRDPKLVAHSGAPKLTAEQERRIATDPSSAGVIIPPGSMPLGTPAQYKTLNIKFTKGIVAMVAEGAFKNNGQNFNWDKFIGTGSSPQQKVLRQTAKTLAPAISNGTFTNTDGAGFNWVAFFIMMAALQLKWEGKFLPLETILRLLQGRIAVTADDTTLEASKAKAAIERTDAEQQLASTTPAGESNANDMMKRLSATGSVLDYTKLDVAGSLQNSQHRGPVADQMMQNMISKMATGEELPMLSSDAGGTETEEMLATHHVSDADVQKYADETPDDRGRCSVEELAERVLCEAYPGGKRVVRTVLTPEEVARLTPKNQETYREAYQKNISLRQNDWFGRAGQLAFEREVLLSASKDARAEARRLEAAGDAAKAAICDKYADAFAIKASRFSEMHEQPDLEHPEADTPQARSSSDTPPDNAPGNSAPGNSAPGNGTTSNHDTRPPSGAGSNSKDGDGKIQPYVSEFNRALRVAQRSIRPNEETANTAHQQITYMSYIAKQLNDRIAKLPTDVTIRDKSFVPRNEEERQELEKSLRQERVIDAQRGMLRNTGIGLCFRQIGLGNLLGKTNKFFLTGNMQDPWELGQLRLTQARKAYATAKEGGVEQQIQEKKRELRNAKVYIQHFESLTSQEHLNTLRIHSAMTHAFAKGQQKVFAARLQAALEGRDTAELDLSDIEKSRERGLPKHEQLPSVAELSTMLTGVSRNKLLKHLDQRKDIMTVKRDEYVAQAKEAQNDPAKREPLEKAVENINEESTQLDEMAKLIKGTGKGPEVTNDLWRDASKTRLFDTRSITKHLRRIGRANEADEMPVADTDTPFFGTMKAKKAPPQEASSIFAKKGDKGTAETADDEDDVDVNDVDYNDRDDVYGALQARADAVNDVHGDLNLEGNTTGAYRNKVIKRLIAADVQTRNVDLSQLPQQSASDVENSSQGVADMANQGIQAMVQSCEDGRQKTGGLADQMQQVATQPVRGGA